MKKVAHLDDDVTDFKAGPGGRWGGVQVGHKGGLGTVGPTPNGQSQVAVQFSVHL